MSFAVLALSVAGAGVLGLALTGAAVALLPLPPVGRALALLVGLVATVAAMGVASNRVTARAIRAEYGDDEAGEAHEPGEADDRRGAGDGLG